MLTNLNILNDFFLVFTKHVKWTLRVSNKLMLFQSSCFPFIVKLLWGWNGEINSNRRASTSQILWKNIYKTWIRGCFHSNRQSSNVTLKRFIKARLVNKAAEKMLCMWVLAYSQSLRSHGFNSVLSPSRLCLRLFWIRSRERSGMTAHVQASPSHSS